MRKTYELIIEGKNPDRVLEAIKHDIRKYVKRERRRELPEGVDFLDFDVKFGLTSEAAEAAHLATLIGLIDTAVAGGAKAFYVELVAKPGHRTARPPSAAGAVASASTAEAAAQFLDED